MTGPFLLTSHLPFHAFLGRLALELPGLSLFELGGTFAWSNRTLARCWRTQSGGVSHLASPGVAGALCFQALWRVEENEDLGSQKDC